MPANRPSEPRHVVDTHRHPFGPRLVGRMAERGFFDPNRSFPQAGAGDVMYYREFLDLDYAMPKQREGGVTLSLASGGGEIDWIARYVLQMSTNDALKFIHDEYLR
jgi:hypothetical protein